MTTYRKAELFEEMLDWLYDQWGAGPVELALALDALGLTKEETIAQLNTWGYDGEAAWEAYEEW